MAAALTTADAKAHLRVYHTLDDSYIASLITAATHEWTAVTHMPLEATSYTHVYEAAPVDGVYRIYHHPLVLNSITANYTDPVAGLTVDPVSQSVVTVLDGYAQIVPTAEQVATWTFPVTLSYTAGVAAIPASVKQALLLRIGYWYSFRGDDVHPPDTAAWQMLAARYRTGALL